MGSFPTDFNLQAISEDITSYKSDVLIIPVCQKLSEDKNRVKKSDNLVFTWTAFHKKLDNAMNRHMQLTLKEENFKGESGKKRIFKVYKDSSLNARWVVVVGLGMPDKLNIKKVGQILCNAIKDTYSFEKIHSATFYIPSEQEIGFSSVDWIKSVTFASVQSTYKTQEAGEKKIHSLKEVSIVLPTMEKTLDRELNAAKIMAFAETFTKDMANKPANLKTAQWLAEMAQSMENLKSVTVKVISDSKIIKKEMPAFWAVAQGSAKTDPPRFIQVNYKPAASGKSVKKIALVGKGVIFDTGGVQVKTGNGMNDMKFDMTGAATVLAAIKAVAELGLKGVEVSAYIAATRNMIGENAYLPDSIIDSASGKRIEIRHTDAEGRVTLADAVYKAVQDKPDEIITVATLTGSAGAAVGHCIALMGTDDKLLDRVKQSSKSVGENIQALELMEEDFETIKSERDSADLSNTAKSRNRGHMSAGAFVISFASKIPVAHLDIAGGDAKDGNATGIAVKGLIEYLRKEAL